MVNFIKACCMVREGKKIRRHCWGNNECFVKDISDFSKILEYDDFLANDWEGYTLVGEKNNGNV